MSSENKIPVNLYGLVDNELARMHTLMQTYLTLPADSSSAGYGGLSSARSFGSAPSQIPIIYKRITELQDLLVKSLIAHDQLLQDKIAEVAMMGTEEVPSVPK